MQALASFIYLIRRELIVRRTLNSAVVFWDYTHSNRMLKKKLY